MATLKTIPERTAEQYTATAEELFTEAWNANVESENKLNAISVRRDFQDEFENKVKLANLAVAIAQRKAGH